MPDEHAVVCCPGCGSELSVELGIVRLTKPVPASHQLDLGQQRPRVVEGFPVDAEVTYAEPEWAQAAARVANAGGYTIEQLRERTRSFGVSRVRQAAMHAAREADGTLGEIGALFDRDTSTVLHAVRAHERREAAA